MINEYFKEFRRLVQGKYYMKDSTNPINKIYNGTHYHRIIKVFKPISYAQMYAVLSECITYDKVLNKYLFHGKWVYYVMDYAHFLNLYGAKITPNKFKKIKELAH